MVRVSQLTLLRLRGGKNITKSLWICTMLCYTYEKTRDSYGLTSELLPPAHLNLGDDIGEDHTLGELFLSWKSPGETYPALLELCHNNDFKAISLWIGVPILREILNLWMRSDILKVECSF